MSGTTTPDRSGTVARIGLGSLVPAVLLAAAILATVWTIAAGDRTATAIMHDRALLGRAEAILSVMKDLETGERGFLLTGEDEFLEPYRAAQAKLEELLPRTEISNVTAEADLPVLARLVAAKRAIATRAIDTRSTQGLKAAMAFSDPVKTKRRWTRSGHGSLP